MKKEIAITAYKCKKCGKLHYPFHDRCLECKGREFEKVKPQGNAKLLTYTAIFAAIGSVFTKRPMIVGLIYGVIETILSFIPALVSTLTVTYFLRSLALRIIQPKNLPGELTRILGDTSLPIALLVLGGMIAGALALASWICTTREYVMAEQV